MTDQSKREKVVAQILEHLGTPPNLIKAEAKYLWPDHYRVNLWQQVGDGLVKGGRIAHSYFVETDGEGLVYSVRPSLQPRYGRPPARPARRARHAPLPA